MVKTHSFNNRAFTLIELIISMGIFVITLAIASGGFLSVVRTQRTASALMAASDSMNVTLEQMMREMRTSYNFCTASGPFFSDADCSSVPQGGIQFVNADNLVIRYILNGGTSAIERCIGAESGGGFSCSPVTAENVEIKKFVAELAGAGENDKRPPRVTLRFEIASTDPQVKRLGISTTIETTVSARCGPSALATSTTGFSCPAET